MDRLGFRALVLASLMLWLFAPCAALAQTPASSAAQVQQVSDELGRLRLEFESLRQQYDQRISILEHRIGELSGPNVLAPAPPPLDTAGPDLAQTVPAAGPPTPAQAVPPAGSVFRPDTSVVGHFVGAAGANPKSHQPSMQMSDVELALHAPVDAYATADVFLAARPQGLEVEEAFATLDHLPAGLLARVGKMRAQFGQINTTHTHLLPWADRPLVMQNLLGGDEGISDVGVSVSRRFPNRVMLVEAGGEVFRGFSNVFDNSGQRSRLSYVERLRASRDLREGSRLDVGVSFAQGYSTEWQDFLKDLSGFDATFQSRPLRGASDHRVVARTEVVWSRQEAPAWATTAFGWYGSVDYPVARRWYVGARVDRSERALHVGGADSGGSVYLTFWPGTSSQLRGQYRRTSYASGITANEFLFQFDFAVGPHGAHVF